MSEIWHAIGSFFESTFKIIDVLENKVNYIYIVIIFAFLVIWTIKMIKHRKNNEEHAPL